jgi:hypothetical protein
MATSGTYQPLAEGDAAPVTASQKEQQSQVPDLERLTEKEQSRLPAAPATNPDEIQDEGVQKLRAQEQQQGEGGERAQEVVTTGHSMLPGYSAASLAEAGGVQDTSEPSEGRKAPAETSGSD